jgi:hypothetical protein
MCKYIFYGLCFDNLVLLCNIEIEYMVESIMLYDVINGFSSVRGIIVGVY